MKIPSLISLIFILLILISSPVVAGKKESKTDVTTTLTIKGIVQDQMTREKLAGVSIQVVTDTVTIYSDPDGSFILPDFDPERTTIKVKCISYKDKELTIDPKSIKKGKLNVFLEPVLP